MNGQQQAILEILLSNESYVSYDMLASRLNVSSRTIMRLLKNVGGFLSDFSVTVEMKRRSGIRLAGTVESLEQLRSALRMEKTIEYTGKDRLLLILFELLQTREPVKAYYLAYLLNVSVGTVNRDLEEAGRLLDKNGLKLKSQRGSGWMLTGGRYAARQFLAALFWKYVDLRDWNGEEGKITFRIQLSASVRKRFLEFMDLPGLYRTYMLVQAFDYTIEENFVREDFYKYVIYTHITLHFSWLAYHFPDEEKGLDLKEHVLYPRMREFAKKVRKEEELTLLEEDLCELLAVYLSMRSNESLCRVYKYDEEVHQMTLELLEDIETELQRKLTADKLLVERLGAHLNLMFDRLHLGTVADSADLDQLKEEYPHIFEIVERKVGIFAKRNQVDISEGETGYIVIHILASILEQESEKQKIRTVVLCMSGIGTSQMLAQRLRQHFARMELLAVYSLEEFHEEELLQKGIDLVVSTIGMEALPVPVAVIHPMPSDGDFLKLERLCQEITEKKLKASFAEAPKIGEKTGGYQVERALAQLACMEHILENFSMETIWADTLDGLYGEISERMFPDRRKGEEFARLLEKRGKQGSIVFHSAGMLLLHGRLGEESCLKVFSVLGTPDYIDGEKIVTVRRAVVMAAPRYAEEETLKLFSCISAALIQEPELVKAIEEEKEEQIFRILGKLMSREIFG